MTIINISLIFGIVNSQNFQFALSGLKKNKMMTLK